MTGWFPAIGVDRLKGVVINRAVDGSFQSRLALQLAEIRTDKPGAPILLEASYLQGAGERCSGLLDVSNDTAANFFMRLGVAYSVQTGASPAGADVGFQVAYDACGQVVGGASLNLATPGTASQHVPITGWLPAIHADKVKALIVVTNAFGAFRAQLAYRTATSIQQITNAWSTNFEGAWHSGNGEYNTGELALSTGSAMWIQFGLEHSLSSGANGGAQVDTAVAIRRT
ncbi:hypothetical protein L6R53_32930 [Myxococcota bacterium]|nr:hypothetical protein [Myxococcota bacterium]